MHNFNGKMRFYCCLLIVLFVIDTTLAVNKTTSIKQTNSSDVKVNADTKNKRQINQFIRTAGTNDDDGGGGGGSDGGNAPSIEQSEALPLQLTHAIYGQQQGHSQQIQQQQQQIFGRRPSPKNDRVQVTEDVDEENEQEPQQQQRHEQQLPSYYNYVPDIDDGNDDGTQQIDSRNLPVEPRNKPYPSTQRVQYAPVTPKQDAQQINPGQSLISEDEYLELIRNAELGKSTQFPGSKSPFAYVSASPSAPSAPTAIENTYDYATKSPFSDNEYKRYTSRVPSSTPAPRLQQQSSQQQQYIRQQPTQYVSHQPSYYTTAPMHDSYSASYDKDSNARINVKKYQDTKLKFQTDSTRGQYHQEVTVKPTPKKFVSFKPSYQFSQPQYTVPSQASPAPVNPTIQSQPLHYQSVQHFAQDEQSIKVGQATAAQPQRQYSLIVPQSTGQQQQQSSYYPQDNAYRGDYYAQSERFTSGNYQQNPEQPADVKPTSEIRVQFVHQQTPTPTPTPGPQRIKYIADNQPLKYEIYDPNGGHIQKDNKPTIKLIAAPQNLHRPQYVDHHPYYTKKIKIQPQAHVHHYVHQPHVVRVHQPTAQPTVQSSAQTQPEVVVPIQPSRATYYAAQSVNEARAAPSSGEKQSIPAGHQTHTNGNSDLPQVRKPIPSLPITNPKKPISQAEFQALVDAGYKVQAIPVPVPVPVPSDKLRQLQQQQQQQQQRQQSNGHAHVQPIHHHHNHPIQSNRPQGGPHYIRYHPQQQESEEGILTSYLRPLMEYIGGPGKQ